jgi:hypothetical protein
MTISLPTTLISEGFATGDSTKTFPVPVTSQIGITNGAASFADGFPPLTRTALGAGGIPPSGEDMNGILYQITQLLAWSASGGFFQYNATQSSAIGGYPLGAILQSSDGSGHLWLNTLTGNTTNPDSGGGNWLPLPFAGVQGVNLTTGTVVLTSQQAARPIITLTGTLSGNVTLNFPANAGQQWVVANYCQMAGHTITLQTAAAGNLTTLTTIGGYTGAVNVFSDGTNLWCNNVSTSGYAPLYSPVFIGTPTAPTANAGTNTTQIATTANVVATIGAYLSGYAPLVSPTLSGSPTTPTAATGNSSAVIANTAFVNNEIANNAVASTVAGTQIRRGSFTCANGTVGVPFATAFPTACDQVFVQWAYANPDAGYVTGVSTTGFTYVNGNSGTCYYVAYGR